MIKRILLAVATGLWLCSSLTAGIVNNAGTSSEDSLSVVVMNCDSLGNPTYADSFFVLVFGPSGDSVFAERATVSSEHIDSSVISNVTLYRYTVAVTDIDGPGQPGVYSLTIVAQQNNPLLRWTTSCQFQVVTSNLADQLTMISDLSDSLASQASWAARQEEVANLDGFDPSEDSVLTKNPDAYQAPISPQGVADTLFQRDSLAFGAGYWHKVANRADSGAAGGSSDSTSIARWVWNTPQVNHSTPGTFGGNLDGPITSIGGGAGAYSQTLCAFDSISHVAIPGVNLAVRNESQTAVFGVVRTDLNGSANVNLDAGEYIVIANAAGYLFASPDTVLVGSGLPDTVYGTRFDPGTPTSLELCRVYGHVYGLDGSPEESAVVQAYLPAGVARYSGVIVAPFSVSAVTDEDGYFYLDLMPSDSLQPSGAQYEFTIRLGDGTILRRKLNVPAVPMWQLAW